MKSSDWNEVVLIELTVMEENLKVMMMIWYLLISLFVCHAVRVKETNPNGFRKPNDLYSSFLVSYCYLIEFKNNKVGLVNPVVLERWECPNFLPPPPPQKKELSLGSNHRIMVQSIIHINRCKCVDTEEFTKWWQTTSREQDWSMLG